VIVLLLLLSLILLAIVRPGFVRFLFPIAFLAMMVAIGGLAHAASNDCLTDGRVLTMRGIVVDKAFMDSSVADGHEGQLFEHHYTALQFYRPRCVKTEFYGYESSIMFEQLLDMPEYWMGHHVVVTVKVEESGGTIHWPTSVALASIDVLDDPREEAANAKFK
jgi:hypothetical protein